MPELEGPELTVADFCEAWAYFVACGNSHLGGMSIPQISGALIVERFPKLVETIRTDVGDFIGEPDVVNMVHNLHDWFSDIPHFWNGFLIAVNTFHDVAAEQPPEPGCANFVRRPADNAHPDFIRHFEDEASLRKDDGQTQRRSVLFVFLTELVPVFKKLEQSVDISHTREFWGSHGTSVNFDVGKCSRNDTCYMVEDACLGEAGLPHPSERGHWCSRSPVCSVLRA